MFSLSLDYTDQQSSGTTRLRIEMKTDATYKGEVGEDAWLINPVKADIDFTYNVSGSIRDPSGAIATPAGSNSAQRVNIDFTVGRGLSAPDIGAFRRRSHWRALRGGLCRWNCARVLGRRVLFQGANPMAQPREMRQS